MEKGRIQLFYTKKCEPYLKRVSEALDSVYGLETYDNKDLELSSTAYDAERKQYNAESLLEILTRSKTERLALWLVHMDIYTKDTNYALGYAAYDYGAVLSSYRISDPDLVEKESLHEVGHVLGLSHCSNRCLMRFSNSVAEAKAKPLRLCDSCKSCMIK